MTAPLPEQAMKLLNGWEVRVMVLLSLFLRIILIILGNQRKYSRNIWINLVVWLAYLSADWVAIVALGNLARSRGEDNSSQYSNNVLQAFWAPFLLLHLGGPDTITAYSLEDNELWLRHFLGLMVQVGVAFYVFMRYCWSSNNALTFLAIPMFITGVIKYGERTLVLRSSSAKQLKDSLHSSPDTPDQDFDELVSALEEGFPVGLRPGGSETVADMPNYECINQNDNYLIEADL